MSQNFAVFSRRKKQLPNVTIARGFDCGVATLNEYLRHFARQNHQSGGAKTFVAVTPNDAACVLGYYSISPGAVEFASVPERLTKKLERFEVPVFRLARLAVAVSAQREGFRRRIVAGGWAGELCPLRTKSVGWLWQSMRRV